MKKLSIVMLLALMLMLCLSSVAAADIIYSGTCGAQGDNLTWTLDSDGVLTISGIGAMADYPSNGASSPWYSHRDNIIYVIIRDGVTGIGNKAFFECEALTNVTIPDSVISIGVSTFAYCNSLESVNIPKDITTISAQAFQHCVSLTEVTIPENVISIGVAAFEECVGLKTILVHNNVSSIGEYAFYNCTGLKTIKYYGTIEEWTSIAIGDHNNELRDATLYYLIDRGTCGADGDNLTWTLDSNGLLTISGEGAMADYMYSTVSSVPWYNNQTSISTIIVGDAVTRIGQFAFYDCSRLSNVMITNSITSIGDSAFYGCEHLKDVYYGGTYEQWAQVDKTVNNSCLTNATIHYVDGIVSRGTCGESLTWTLDEDGVLTISGTGPMYDFDDIDRPWRHVAAEVKSVVICDGVTSIGNLAFSDCTNMSSVDMADSVTSIGTHAIGSLKLTNLIIGNGVKSISPWAFQGCTALLEVTIPKSVTVISTGAFFNCSSLRKVYYEGTATQWEGISISSNSNDPLIYANIAYLGGIASGTCGENLTWVLDNDGVLTISGEGEMGGYSGNNSPWYDFCGEIASVVIENGVASIKDWAFSGCINLVSVAIPNSVNSIGEWAFYDCSSLTEINIPDSVTIMGGWVFYNCSNLSNVTITNLMFYCIDSAGSVFKNCAENLTVYGYSNTWLEGWINKSNISFSSLGNVPNWADENYDRPSVIGRTIHISSAADLAWLAKHVNAGNSLASFTVVLDDDIDLSEKFWTPIGTENSPYAGRFDGQGHTIYGLRISIWEEGRRERGCLFGNAIDADIRNICLADAAVTYGSSDWISVISNNHVNNCGAWGWSCRTAYVYSNPELSWSSFDTPDGNISRISAYNIDGTDVVTPDYLRSDAFRDWINSYPDSGLYDWVADSDGSNKGFPRMTTEGALRTWVDVAETVNVQNGVYNIYTPQQLGYIATLVNSGNTLSGKTIRLQADIDLSEYYWTPLNELSADFDGNGHAITGLKIGKEGFYIRDRNVGLIGLMHGNISVLTVTGYVVSSAYTTGLIAGYADGDIDKCHGSGTVSGGEYYTGGLVGQAAGSFYDCSFSGSVIGYTYVGGIVGYMNWADISRCSVIGTISGNNCVGGICGLIRFTNSAIENCYSICEVVNSGSYSGGILAKATEYQGTIRNCYAGGSVGGSIKVGALFGDLGTMDNRIIENCYWNQDGSYTLGGIPVDPVAYGGSEEIETGVTALTAEQMRQQSSFVGFDFDTVWAIDSSTNDGMPYLRQDEPEYMPGDINGDGVLNNKDVTRLMRYIKYHDVDVEEAALDVNGDGVVNNKDVTRLMRYIKYGDVEIY